MAGVTVVFEDGSEVALDCTLSQNHDRLSELTDHPVEDGVDITDHIKVKPVEVSITAIQSATPIRPFGALGLLFAAITGGLDDAANPHISAYNKLEKAFEKGELVKLETGLKIYEDMAITGLKVSKDSPTYDLPLELVFRKVMKVTAQTVKVPLSALGKATPRATTKPVAKAQIKKTQAQAAPKVTKGPVAKTPASAPQAAKSTSVLYKVLGGKVPL